MQVAKRNSGAMKSLNSIIIMMVICTILMELHIKFSYYKTDLKLRIHMYKSILYVLAMYTVQHNYYYIHIYIYIYIYYSAVHFHRITG